MLGEGAQRVVPARLLRDSRSSTSFVDALFLAILLAAVSHLGESPWANAVMLRALRFSREEMDRSSWIARADAGQRGRKLYYLASMPKITF